MVLMQFDYKDGERNNNDDNIPMALSRYILSFSSSSVFLELIEHLTFTQTFWFKKVVLSIFNE